MSIRVRMTPRLRGEGGERVRRRCLPRADQQAVPQAPGVEWLPGRVERRVMVPPVGKPL